MARISAWALALIACAFCSADAAVTAQQSGSAVQKIIQMLTDMAGKAKIEKADEEVAFAKFTTWCAAESVNSKNEIHKNGEEIELLTASIAELTDNVKSLGQEISDLQASVSQHTADKKAQDEKRAKDHASFQEEQQDFSESVDALERAITMLQKQDYDRAGSSASALLQIQADQKLPAAAKSIVTALIGMDGPDYAAPEANGYEFQSGGIVDMLKKLNDEFREKLATCQKEEANSKHAYNMIVEDLTDSIENAEKDASEKTAEKEGKAEKKALDQKQLNAVVAMKAENEKMFSETTAECSEKKMSFEEKQTLRAEEIQAIMKAVEIMGSPDVAGASEKHLALAQAGQAKALIQHLRSANVQTGKEESDMSPRRRVKAFLESEGDRLKSKDLSLLAQKLASDPFAKVKKMIDDMITRLMEEANQDAEHEGFCDTELGKNKITRNKLSEDIDMLTSGVENGKSEIMMLSESTADLSKELAQLDQAVQEATVLRNGEKSKNSETVKDAEAAQTAIAAASAVLREFYEKAAMATGFLQTQKRPTMGSEEWNSLANPNFKGEVDKGHKAGMQTFGETYQGNQDANNGVMALLEVLASDFASLEADTNAAEAAAKEAYDRFTVESKKNKAVKERKASMNDSDRASAESKLREDIADLKATQDELLAADRYYDKLVPQCLDQGMTWEERTAARAAEVSSLKEALKILESNGSVA